LSNRLAALADPLRVEKNDEQDAGHAKDQPGEFRHRAASLLGVVEFIGAIAGALDRYANLIEARRGRIERDRNHLRRVVGLDRSHSGKLAHGSFDNVLAAMAMHAMRVEGDARLTHRSVVSPCMKSLLPLAERVNDFETAGFGI
jgi:hypothetical protein